MPISKIKTKSIELSAVNSDIILNNTIKLIDLNSEVSDLILSTYSTVSSTSANWDSVYTTVQTESASWGSGGGGGPSDVIDLLFKLAYTTYYHELNYDSITTDLSSVQIYEDNTKTTHLFEKLLTYTSTALLTGIFITDKVNNNTLTKTLSYDGNDNLISTTRIYT